MTGDEASARFRHQRIGDLYLAALDLPPGSRGDFLDQACANDALLRQEVAALLIANEDEDRFLSRPIVAPVEAAPRWVGPYRLMQAIGEGGMGEVWLGEQTQPIRRRAAIKLIKPGMATKEVVARFECERQALAMMDHPAIAKVLDAGSTNDGRPYFVMEYVPGVPIVQHCQTHRLSTKDRLRLFLQVCEGVQHAHGHGIIHRDLKPSNILIAIKDQVAVAKIIDFGVAKATAQPLTDRTMFTEIGAMIGTPEYMSPEQAGVTAQDIDLRTDVYSLGVILYELMVGALPFDAAALRQWGRQGIQQALRELDPAPPSSRLRSLTQSGTGPGRSADRQTLESELRGDLDWIIMKAIEKDRTRRYGSALEFAEDLQRHLSNRPVRAHPPSNLYRAGRLLRRHRSRALAVAGIAFSIGAILATYRFASHRPATDGALPRSIAVLAFDDLSASRNQGVLAEGLAEELQDALFRAGWRVAPRRSAAWFTGKREEPRAIGQKLNVAVLLTGSIRSQGNRAKVAVQLVRAADGDALWQDTFERDGDDAFAVQEDVARAVTQALGASREARKAPGEPANRDAYHAYVEGRYFLERANPENFDRSLRAFRRAIDLSPNYAKAWVGLSQTLTSRADWGLAGPEAYREAQAAAGRAVDLDPHSAEAQASVGRLKMFANWDLSGADDAFRQGLKLDPENADVVFGAALLARAQGRLNEAIQFHRRDVAIDPMNPSAHHDLGMTLHYLGRNAEAEKAMVKSIELAAEGGNFHAMMSRIYLAQSRHLEALAEAKKETHPLFRLCGLALAHQALGQRRESDASLAELIRLGSKDAAYNIAGVYAARDDKVRAFQWLDRAIRQRDTGLIAEIKTDPLLENLRFDARWEPLLRQLNLPR